MLIKGEVMLSRTHLLPVLVLLAACGDPTEPSLLEESDESSSYLDELRRRDNLRYVDAYGVEQQLELDNETDVQRLLTELRVTCRQGRLTEVENPNNNPCTLEGHNACHANHCAAYAGMCIAQVLEELAGVISEPLQLESGWQVPPQNLPTRARLHELAVEVARDDVILPVVDEFRTIEELDTVGGCTEDTMAGTWGNSGQSLGRSFAMLLVEALELAREGTYAAVDANVALADSYFSELPTESAAADIAMSAPLQSRAHAVHLLLGGDEGLHDVTAEQFSTGGGFCTSPELSPEARAAVGIFRESAIDPSTLRLRQTLGPDAGDFMVPIEQVLLGQGGVRERLTELWGESSWATDDLDEFCNRFGLDVGAFVEARQYLVEEHVAFARSDSQTLPPRPAPGGGVTSWPRFAATAQPPEPAPAVHYASLATYRSSFPVYTWKPNTTYARTGYAPLLDYALSTAYELISSEANIANSSLRADVLDPIALVLSEGVVARPNRVRGWVSASSGTAHVRVYHSPDVNSSEFILVSSLDSIRCATTGAIEGQPCGWTDVNAIAYTDNQDLRVPGSLGEGFEFWTRWILASGTWPERFFVARLRSGGVPNKPGQYEVVGGGWLLADNNENTSWVYPVIPEIESRVAEILAPSPDWCTHARETCAGTSFDERIPLENELSEDGDAFESSWRHYLTLARQAADEADALGEKVIEDGLAMDLRAEAALEELEELCGASVDLSRLISDDFSGTRTGTPCTSCTEGQRCIAGQCIATAIDTAAADAEEDPAMTRLAECLGDDSVLPFVHLGAQDQVLCLWHAAGNPTQLCPGAAAADRQCPEPANSDGTCPAPPDASYVSVTVEAGLGYFTADSGPNPDEGSSAPCELVRALRDPASAIPWDRAYYPIVESGFFDPVLMQELATRIGWEARIGDYSAITLDGRDWIRTGDPRTGTEPNWPCSATGIMVDCSDGEGLFCSVAACNSQTNRAIFNNRLARAVITARTLTGLGLEGVRMPFVRPDDGAVGGLVDTSYEGFVGTVPVNVQEGQMADWRSLPHGGRSRIACIESVETAWTHIDIDGGIAIPTGHSAQCGLVNLGVFDFGATLAGTFEVFSTTSEPRTYVEYWYGLGAVEGRRRPDARRLGNRIATILGGSNATVDFALAGMDYLERRSACSFTDDTCTRRTDRNDSWISLTPVYTRDVLDAVELLCETAKATGPIDCDTDPIPAVTGPSDLPAVKQHLECAAHAIEQRAAHTVLANVPVRVVDALRTESAVGSYPAVGGSYGAQVSRLRAALIEISEVQPLIAGKLRLLSDEIERLRLNLAREDIRDRIAHVEFESTRAGQVANCVQSTASGGWTGLISGAAACANAVAQINFAAQIEDLSMEDAELSRQLATLGFSESFYNISESLQSLSLRLKAAVETHACPV